MNTHAFSRTECTSCDIIITPEDRKRMKERERYAEMSIEAKQIKRTKVKETRVKRSTILQGTTYIFV